jgi:hypothetical protein
MTFLEALHQKLDVSGSPQARKNLVLCTNPYLPLRIGIPDYPEELHNKLLECKRHMI